MVKERITLTVDKEVVEKAKDLDINISRITEKVLKGLTSAERPNGSLIDAYRQWFDSMLPLLKKFDCDVKIAEGEDTVVYTDDEGKEYETEISVDIFLEPDGSFYIAEYDSYFEDISKIAPRHFLGPERILSNFVDALSRNKEAMKEKIKEILMAKNIVKAIFKTLVMQPSTTRYKERTRDSKIKAAPKKYRRVTPSPKNETKTRSNAHRK